jgi:hypothetical protein
MKGRQISKDLLPISARQPVLFERTIRRGGLCQRQKKFSNQRRLFG